VTAPHEAGGAGPDVWLDMSRYPDTDPDTALTGQEHELLSTSLAVDDAELPDAVWEHMLAVVTGDTGDGADDDATAEDVAADDGADDWSGWAADPALDGDDPGADPADDPAVDPADHHDGTGWDGGTV